MTILQPIHYWRVNKNRLSEIKNNKNLGACILHRLHCLLRPEQCHQN